jgi:hypothetical protein
MAVSWIRRLSERKCITEHLETSQPQGCEYRVSPGRAQAGRLLSVLKVITRREGGGRVLGVHGASTGNQSVGIENDQN